MMEEKIWTVETQVTHKLWAKSEDEAIRLSRLVEPFDQVSTAWITEEGESNDEA